MMKNLNMGGYNFNKPPPLGNVIDAMPYWLNDTQKMIEEQVAGLQHQELAFATYHPNR